METFLFRIILAGFIGFIIGKRSDTFHTAIVFAIACMGTALLTITSTEFYKLSTFPWMGDPGRLSAQVISALGFIGSGMIWITRDKKIVGLPVAANLWITAILGMLIGAGLENATVMAAFFVIIIYYLSDLVIRWKKK
jgi:putative Mg2+ transporter-C (MgtC) family protein